MGFLDKINGIFSGGKLKKEQLERLQDSIWQALSDGYIDDKELEYINGFYSESELKPEEFQQLKSEIFQQVVQRTIVDKRVNPDEIKTLEHLIERLEIPKSVELWAKQQVGYFALFAQIESGLPLPVGKATGLVMQKNEVCHLSLPAQLLEERVVNRRYVGNSHGMSFRIMKGVSYRVGQQHGHIESERALVPVSTGYFIITNKRLVFSGNAKSIATPYGKLLDLQIYGDGISFSTTTRQKQVMVKLSRSEEADLCALLISRIINEA